MTSWRKTPVEWNAAQLEADAGAESAWRLGGTEALRAFIISSCVGMLAVRCPACDPNHPGFSRETLGAVWGSPRERRARCVPCSMWASPYVGMGRLLVRRVRA